MATKHASHSAKMIAAKTSGSQGNSLRGSDALADLVCIVSTYTTDGTEAANDIIKLTAELPAGLVLVPALSTVVVRTDPGTALLIDVGTADDDTAFSAGVDLGTVGKKDLGLLPVTDLPEAQEIIATIGTATSITANRDIDFYLVFRSVS